MSQRYLGGVITANPTTPTTASASGVWTLEQQFQYLQGVSPRTIGNSVRLRASASAYLNRTPASASNRRTWTWSGWVKRGTLSSAQVLFCSDVGTSNSTWLELGFDAGNTITLQGYTTDSNTTSAVFRDPSAWYHVVVQFDSTQATAANRCRIYINGVQQTLTGAGFTLNYEYGINYNQAHGIGYRNWASGVGRYFDGYMAEVNFVDGQALTPSSFGAFDGNGVWQPLTYTGTYGTNGFYLTFADNSAATATTLGKDYSGNGNNWTPNNISVTSGVTYDWMLDSPSNYADGGNGRGNYGTLNPLYKGSLQTISNGNLTSSKSSGTNISDVWGNFGMTSGKWYFECTVTALASTVYIGVGQGGGVGEPTDDLAVSPASYFYGSVDGNKNYGGTSSAYGNTYTTGDVIGCAIDMDSGKIWWSKNNTWQASGDPAAGTNAAFTDLLTRGSNAFLAFASTNGASNSNTLNWNFGQRPFAYTPPTGFLALNTQNLPAVNINNGAQYMAATLYTGNGSTQSISNGANNTIGITFQPDLFWAKSRSSSGTHSLTDSVRGVNSQLFSNLTNAEGTQTDQVTAFNSNGVSLGANVAGTGSTNVNTVTYVGWQWKAAGSSVSNTNGSITSSVSANTTAGFSVVTYTGTGANATVGHGLGVAPKMVIVKDRNRVTDWSCLAMAANSGAGYLGWIRLNTTDAWSTTAILWNNTAPTSSVFSIGTYDYVNYSGSNYVAYCFAEVAGYSKFGSYTGNGSSDGPFVYCGFRPRFIMVKCSSTTGNWIIDDSSRNTYNVVDLELYPSLSNAESSDPSYDFLSNGFKLRATSSNKNSSGATYIYMAFAENPFNIARAR